jgi:hypothetical protein
MIVRLAEELQIPLRQRNVLLTAAGFAKMYSERSLDDPALGVVGNIVQKILSGHEPNPAVAIDHQWRANAIAKLKQRIEMTADRQLIELLKEIESYRYREVLDQPERKLRRDVAIPLELETAYGDVNLITTSMVFGYPRDITVSEIAIECFFLKIENPPKC